MKPTFQRPDWLAAIVSTVIAMAVYAYTTAPNVTLLDSGEFLVAAQHFGVPHPTGYPLWTIVSWLFQLLPLGNVAWEIALCSAVCGALAVGICALLSSSLIAWMGFLERSSAPAFVRPTIAIAFSLLLAFSQSMWSQAVIAEVYALHALMIGLYFLFLYAWLRRPHKDSLMLAAFFVLALSFSNHHLTLALSPLPFLLVLLLRRRAFWDWFMAGILTALLVYLGFAILSGEVLVLTTAIRFFYCVLVGFAVLLWLRKFRIRWHLVAFLPLVVILGLLPYVYMPFASSTNPPMNWSYAREPQGFFYSVNRSQYSGPLTEQSLKTLGRAMGTYQQGPASAQKDPLSSSTNELKSWIGFFWLKLAQSFTPFCVIFYFASFLAVFRLPLAQRTWVYLLHVAFILAAFLQPVMDAARIDNDGWWLQMPYHTYTNFIFAVLLSLGAAFLVSLLIKRHRIFAYFAVIFLLMPVFTLRGNYALCSQRDHWFGWMFGYDMLKDLPKNSIVIGGTDPGRFVPTYMILGESTQPAAFKHDPNFDRRDLYIITQNALGEPQYMKYLRDQYTTARPAVASRFEKWLGREQAYPEKPILLPSEKEVDQLIEQATKMVKADPKIDAQIEVFASTLQWIWEKNPDHEFFVEESFPLTWTYDYAIPHGLIYKLGREKTGTLPPEIVAQDFAFWKEYKARLLGNPLYKQDFDAQRSFSKLRQSIANIYRHKKMDAEAIRAYEEALELWPENGETLATLGDYLWKAGNYDRAVELLTVATQNDPNNIGLWRLRFLAENRKAAEVEMEALREKLTRQPKHRESIAKLLELYTKFGEKKRGDQLATLTLQDFSSDADMLRVITLFYQENGEMEKSIAAARQLVAAESTNAQNYILLANAYYAEGRKKEFYEVANKAIEIGGLSIRDTFAEAPSLAPWRNEPEFQQMITPRNEALPAGGTP